jgi:hypothetical protein
MAARRLRGALRNIGGRDLYPGRLILSTRKVDAYKEFVGWQHWPPWFNCVQPSPGFYGDHARAEKARLSALGLMLGDVA